jgi:hypothetical protein
MHLRYIYALPDPLATRQLREHIPGRSGSMFSVLGPRLQPKIFGVRRQHYAFRASPARVPGPQPTPPQCML